MSVSNFSKVSEFASELDVAGIRQQFPILHQTVKDKPLIYFDSAASSQKPRSVIDAISNYYLHDHSNVHRGVHTLSERATDGFEQARESVRSFINANSTNEVIFVRGATEAINLVAFSYGESFVNEGDSVVVTEMEHHANIVPWQMMCERRKAKLLVVPIHDDGQLNLDVYKQHLQRSPKIVAMTQVSNALGTVNPVKEMTILAHDAGAVVLLDGAQAVPHCGVDMQELDCDFYAFSAHKMYGPTGVGVLYGKEDLLDRMAPWQSGGEMIRKVTFEHTEYNTLPWKFEAGTPDISGSIGLDYAIRFMQEIGISRIAEHEAALLAYATHLANERKWMRVIGTAPEKAGVLSFVLDDIHANDVGLMLDADGIAIRTGHHCAMPVMQHFSLPATARISFGVYNTFNEIDSVYTSIDKIHKIFS